MLPFKTNWHFVQGQERSYIGEWKKVLVLSILLAVPPLFNPNRNLLRKLAEHCACNGRVVGSIPMGDQYKKVKTKPALATVSHSG